MRLVIHLISSLCFSNSIKDNLLACSHLLSYTDKKEFTTSTEQDYENCDLETVEGFLSLPLK